MGILSAFPDDPNEPRLTSIATGHLRFEKTEVRMPRCDRWRPERYAFGWI